MDILVIGGTGTVGTHAVRGFVERGESPRVLTREPAKGAVDGAEYVEGALGDPDALRAALDGIEAVLLITPLHPQEADLGVAAVGAMADAGVGRIVLQSIHQADAVPEAPHFAAKERIRNEMAATGIPHTVVAPNSFFQNDLRLKQPLLEYGVYPQPLGNVGVTRVDARDVADAHVRALLDLEAEGVTWPVVGPTTWTAEETAEEWSRALGREIHYAGDDLQAFADRMEGAMPGWMIEDLAAMYRSFQRRGLIASEEDEERSREIVGHEGRSFETFAAETAKAWE